MLMKAVRMGSPAQIPKTYTEEEDLALVHASRNGDTAAFGELVKRYDRRLLRTAMRLTQNLEDAEEAVQEAFLEAYQSLGQFRGQPNRQYHSQRHLRLERRRRFRQ